MARLQVAEELRLFLPLRARASGTLDVETDATASLGHVVQSAGIPLTEVGELRLAGQVVPDAYRPRRDDVVDVPVRPRPQPLDGPPRLLLDVHLGTLARRLRLLGVDTSYRHDADDDELVAQAAREDRVLLSQDRGLLRRRSVRRAAYVRGSRPDDQLADVLSRFRLPIAPYTVCPACGGSLRPVAKADVVDRLEPGTRRTQHDFRECASCGQVYWRGAHAARLAQLVERYA